MAQVSTAAAAPSSSAALHAKVNSCRPCGRPSRIFVGMPAPAGAVTGLLPVFLHLSLFNMPNIRAMAPLEVAYVLVIAFLMASQIPHFSGKSIGRVPREYVAVVLFGLAAVVLLLANFPMEMLVALSSPISPRSRSAFADSGMRPADEEAALEHGGKSGFPFFRNNIGSAAISGWSPARLRQMAGRS